MRELENVLENWSNLLKSLRKTMVSRGFLEVSTANLVPAGAFEAAIDTFKVSIGSETWELHSSPEFEMKYLVSETKRSLFQITKCYREDPIETGVHLREFTMLEFYRVGGTYRDVLEDTKAIFENAAGATLPFREITAEEALKNTTGFTFDTLPVEKSDTWEDAFFKALIEKIEPSFPHEIPTIFIDYPGALCALGKLSKDRRTTERFEIFWKGMELCNGCTELADSAELENRYHIESASRRRMGKAPHPYPNRLSEAFSRGLPDCAGVAIGVDRLFWALHR